MPDKDGNDHDNNKTDRHRSPGMDFSLKRPSSPNHSVKKGSPEPDDPKPKIKWANWPLGIDKLHKKQYDKRANGPEDGHSNSRSKTGFGRRPITGRRRPWPIITQKD